MMNLSEWVFWSNKDLRSEWFTFAKKRISRMWNNFRRDQSYSFLNPVFDIQAKALQSSHVSEASWNLNWQNQFIISLLMPFLISTNISSYH